MLAWAVAAVVALLTAVGGWLWYNAKKVTKAETSSASDRALREVAEKQAAELEAQRLAAHAAERLKDANEGTKVVESGSGVAAGKFLQDSFPARRPRNP